MNEATTPSAPPRTLPVAECRLRLARPLAQGEATLLRGFFGREFADEVLVHHHQRDGALLYDYPKVQFKVIDRTAHLIGLGEGAAVVARLWASADRTNLGGEELEVLEANLSHRREAFGECDRQLRYTLGTPWLGLNQENHGRYEACRTDGERSSLLGRVLVGNCLSMAKAFGHRVGERLVADVSRLRPTQARLKGVPMLAFCGEFGVNFAVPPLCGLGKSVSRGFGTALPLGGREGQ